MTKKLVILFLAICVSIALPFVIIGELAIDIDWLKQQGQWAWFAAILLLIADLFLALPASAIITALGILYGPILGGLIGAAGSFASGFLGYLLARHLPAGISDRLLGEEKQKAAQIFTKWGFWAIACSRFLPILPEAICLLAGLTRMNKKTFLVALAIGCMPMGFSYAVIPSFTENDDIALLVSIIIPITLAISIKHWPGNRLQDGDRAK